MALLTATALTAAIRPDPPGVTVTAPTRRTAAAAAGVGHRAGHRSGSGRRDRHIAGQRASRLVVFKSVRNALVEPFAAPAPRPGYIAARDALPPGQF
jgi:ectoine hydroxylase